MANWKSIVDISALHTAHQDGSMNIQEVGKQVANRFKANKFVIQAIADNDSEGYDLSCVLEEMENGVDDVNHYDCCLAALYDFADFNHRIWINTTF